MDFFETHDRTETAAAFSVARKKPKSYMEGVPGKCIVFEKRHHPLLDMPAFIRRVLYNLLIGMSVIAISLFGGMVGYREFESMSWTDAFVNAAMILSGMGPVSTLYTESGKIFAGLYALFSGIVFLVVIAIILAPLIHRFFHLFLMNDKK